MKQSPLVHERVFAGDFAKDYARKHQKIAEKFGREMAEKLNSRAFTNGRILDVGCGFGATAIVLAQSLPQSEVVGVDLSDPLLAFANKMVRDNSMGERITFEKADVQEIPYEDDSFDALINLQMLHIVEDPIAMLDEMERVLTPDGVLLMADIRRSWVGLLDKVFKTALTVEEARALRKILDW